MDSATSIITNELTQGMELAKQLKEALNSKSSIEEKEILIQNIICSYDRALCFVKWGSDGDSGGRQVAEVVVPPMLGLPESPLSVNESPQSEPFDNYNQQDQKVVSKKRKTLPTWRNQVRICTENGLEGNTDDGYSWRKYGQKDILGAKFPRSYYRCTYRYVHSCMARKQVQRTDEDPTVFEITYRGTHTCNHAVAATQSVLPPGSPEKHENNHHHNHQNPPIPPKPAKILSNLRENLRVSTSDLDDTVPCSFSFPAASLGYAENYEQFNFVNEIENNNNLQGYSPSFISPATSGLNYFTEWGYDLQHRDESNLSGMISTTASATNSTLDLSPNFPFNNSGFFS